MHRLASIAASLMAGAPSGGRTSAPFAPEFESYSSRDLTSRERRARRNQWRTDFASRVASIPAAIFGPCDSGVALLTYHRLANVSPSAGASYNVTPARFEEQLRGLVAKGYRPRSLAEVLSGDETGRAAMRRSFVVTFDDGYENFYTQAFPILKRLGVPATLFPATAYLDSEEPFPFDAWPSAGDAAIDPTAWRPLRSEQLRELARDPLIAIGSHTHTHADFRGRADDFEFDVATSIDVLRRRFGVKTPMPFSFPYGVASLGFTSGDLLKRVRRLPLTCALSTEPRLAMPGHDPFLWGRFDVKQSDTPGTLAGKIDGWFTWLKRRVGMGPSTPVSP